MTRFDVITMGRVSVDVYPLQDGPLEDVETFGKYLGGSPTNVAVAAARHGLNCAVITRTGDDPFGRYINREVARLGVDPRYVSAVPGPPTPVAFCEIFPPDDFPLYFYRYPTAPDLMIEPDELDLDSIAQARVFWTTVTGLSSNPSRSAHWAAWQVRAKAPLTILDLDYRPMFWPSESIATQEVGLALEQVDVAVGNEEECRIAVGETDADRAADALLERGIRIAVVKRGPLGVLAKTRTERIEVGPTQAHVVNGLGAGDGFGGALCYCLLQNWPLERVVRFASAAGALVTERRECATAMPTTDEVERRLAEMAHV